MRLLTWLAPLLFFPALATAQCPGGANMALTAITLPRTAPAPAPKPPKKKAAPRPQKQGKAPRDSQDPDPRGTAALSQSMEDAITGASEPRPSVDIQALRNQAAALNARLDALNQTAGGLGSSARQAAPPPRDGGAAALSVLQMIGRGGRSHPQKATSPQDSRPAGSSSMPGWRDQ